MSKTISILGTGWLGLPLGKFLLTKGYKVKGSTTSQHKIQQFLGLGIQPYLIDISDDTIGEQGEDFFDADILIITIPPKKDIIKYTMQMKSIAKAIESNTIQHIIYTSSTGVYGASIGFTNEKMLLNPIKDSAKAVVKAEKILSDLNKNLTICRLAGLVGGNRNPARFLAGRQNIPNGNAPVNLVHQKDCVQVISKIIEKNIWNEVFNVCSDTHPSRSLFYTTQAQKQQLAEPTFSKDNTPSSAYKTIDNQKLKRVLNYDLIYSDLLTL